MKNLLKKNTKYLFRKKVFFPRKDSLKKLVSALNKDKIVIISGMRYSGKTKFILEMIQKTQVEDKVFYFNSEVDTLGEISDVSDLKRLFKTHKKNQNTTKIIILQNINKITGIKNYIGELYKEKEYKIIIVGNNIKIGGIEEVEIFPLRIEKLGTEKVQDFLKYGGIEEVQLVRDLYFKTFLLQGITDHIISQDVVYTYDIKNKKLYYQVVSFLAKINKNISLRELQRELESAGISIALMTLTDYIDASVRSKLLKKVTKYDLKKDKEIPTKINYYFGDIGVRNTLLGNIGNEYIILENALFNELEKNGYTVYSGINGRFEMTFRAVRGNKTLSLHIHNSTDKNELKKDVRKLAKLSDTSEKFLIVDDKEVYNMRKYEMDGVKIVELGEVVESL